MARRCIPGGIPTQTAPLPLTSLLVVMACLIPVTTGCPSQCSCSYQAQGQLSVICSTQDMASVPHTISPQTQLLTIMGQRNSPFSLSHLSRKDFQSLGNVRHLTISFTHLASIDEDAFLDLVHLKRIDLANNKLDRLLPNTFITLRNLTLISLSNNPGLVISDRTFWNLQSLQELYLSGLGMTELRPAMFYGLSGLRQLDMSSNKLTSFSPDIMVSVPNLWSLDLAFNELMSLDSLLEPYFVHLKRVQLGGNRWQCNCLLRWLKNYPRFVSPRSSDSPVCAAPAGMEFASLGQLDVQQLVCEPPVIHSCPATVTVLEGGSVIVRCLVTGDPYPSITWTFADGTRMMSGTYPGMPIKDRAAVQVHGVPVTHNGTLTLTAANGVGTESTDIAFIVIRPTTPTTTTTTPTTTSSSNIPSTAPMTTTTATVKSRPTAPTSTTTTTTTTTTTPLIASTSDPSTVTPTTTTTTLSSSRKTSRPASTHNKPSTTTTTIASSKATKSSRKIDGSDAGKTNAAELPAREVDVTPIVIASVASTAAVMMAAGIAIYLLKKKSPSPRHTRHPFKSKVTPHTPDSTLSDNPPTTAGSSTTKEDLTLHVLRMQKFDAPTRPSTLY